MLDDDGCVVDDDDHRQQLKVLPDGVAVRTGLLVHKLANEIVRRAMPGLEALGLDGRDYTVLAVLADDAPASQAELATLCSLLPAQIVPVVDRLEQAGLVERRRAESDRRRFVVRLTTVGRDRLAQADDVARAIEQVLLGAVGQDVQARLRDDLRQALRQAD